MSHSTKNVPLWGISLTSILCLLFGFGWGIGELLGLGAIGCSYMLLRLAALHHERLLEVGRRCYPRRRTAAPAPAAAAMESIPPKRRPKVEGHTDLDTLVAEMLDQGRFAILLRPQIASNLTAEQLEPARTALQEWMALVPEGKVRVRPPRADEEGTSQGLQWVDQLYLDRYPVTNHQYYEFILSGGYEQMAIWEPEIWPAIFDFVDRTGCPGPRHWQNGRYAAGEDNHPVVGVSWYEAAAYARWVGKRLPTDAEWIKAASWPVTLSPTNHVQRKYPWGEAMDFRRANLWASGVGRIADVNQFQDGVSVGGVYGLIGNVWEWTTGNFEAEGFDGEPINAPGMKNIRGGAFDTYFESHATCQFASGDSPMARRHNIGFRCALGICDLGAIDQVGQDTAPAEQNDSVLEEVSV